MTVLVIDVFHQHECALFACFPLPFELQVATGDYIAGLWCFDENPLGNGPTESLCGYLTAMTSDEDHGFWFIKAEKKLTLWMDGKPIKIIRSTVHYPDQSDGDMRVPEKKEVVPDVKSAWDVVSGLAQQFRVNVWTNVLFGGSDEKKSLKGRPKWTVPNVECILAANPLYSAMQSLTQETQTCTAPPALAKTPFEKTPIEKLRLSTRAGNPLNDANIKYVEDLAKMNYDQLIRLRRFGNASFKEVRKKLRDRGFRLSIEWKMPGSSNGGWVPDIP